VKRQRSDFASGAFASGAFASATFVYATLASADAGALGDGASQPRTSPHPSTHFHPNPLRICSIAHAEDARERTRRRPNFVSMREPE